MSWLSDLFRRTSAPTVDASNVALADAYSSLEYREREAMSGRLADNAYGIKRRPTYIQTRWQPRHRDEILAEAETGVFLRLAYFIDAMRSDGLISGLLDTRTGGMLRRPVLFAGDPYLVTQLRGREATYGDDGVVTDAGQPGVWSRMVPTAELAAIVWDGICAGVGVGEMVKDSTGLPVLRHLDLHWLRYDYSNDRYIYQAPSGTYEVRPGDGRWVVFTIKSDRRPWMSGAWFALAWPYISKAGTALDRLRWQGTLADSLKVIRSAKGSTDGHRKGLMRFISDMWHRSPGLVTKEDELAYLVESNGVGYKVYVDSEDRADREIQFTLSGQVVTGNGTSGFSGGDIFDAIKNDIIQATADAAGECVSRDIIAPWALAFWGCRDGAPTATWDVRSPSQRKADAEALSAALDTIAKADGMAGPRGQRVNLAGYLASERVALPLEAIPGFAAPAPSPQAATTTALITLAAPATASTDDDAAQVDEHAAALAEAMTQHGVDSCEHGSKNRCRLCGIERTRELVPGATPGDGQHTWRVVWRPIGAPTAVADSAGKVA